MERRKFTREFKLETVRPRKGLVKTIAYFEGLLQLPHVNDMLKVTK